MTYLQMKIFDLNWKHTYFSIICIDIFPYIIESNILVTHVALYGSFIISELFYDFCVLYKQIFMLCYRILRTIKYFSWSTGTSLALYTCHGSSSCANKDGASH